MRSIALGCWFLLFVITGALNGFGQKFEVGAKIGGSFNDSYGPGTNRFISTPTYGVLTGAYATYFISYRFRIRAEALASTRGFQSESVSFATASSGFSKPTVPLSPSTSQSSTAGSTNYSLNKHTLYIDVPIGVDYEIVPRVILQAGGMLSIFVREYYNSLSSPGTINQQKPDDLAYYQPMQFSLYGGASYRFDFGLSAGARATAGLTNTFVSSSTHADSQIMPYSFRVFVTYPLFKF